MIIRSISKLYGAIRLLSIDVALGGAMLSNSVAYIFDIILPGSISLSLFFAIWAIYTFDHLMDATRLTGKASMERHRFHQQHRKKLMIAMGAVLVLGMINLLFVPVVTLIFGTIVSLIVLIYFILSWKLKVLLIKEVLIASVYTTGVFLGPVSLGINNYEILFYFFIQIFILALLNLLIFSYYEYNNDQQDGQHSWAIKFGQSGTRTHVNAVFIMLAMAQAFSFMLIEGRFLVFQLLLMVMSVILFLVYRQESYFRAYERYRAYGDLIFFIPGIIIWFE